MEAGEKQQSLVHIAPETSADVLVGGLRRHLPGALEQAELVRDDGVLLGLGEDLHEVVPVLVGGLGGAGPESETGGESRALLEVAVAVLLVLAHVGPALLHVVRLPLLVAGMVAVSVGLAALAAAVPVVVAVRTTLASCEEERVLDGAVGSSGGETLPESHVPSLGVTLPGDVFAAQLGPLSLALVDLVDHGGDLVHESDADAGVIVDAADAVFHGVLVAVRLAGGKSGVGKGVGLEFRGELLLVEMVQWIVEGHLFLLGVPRVPSLDGQDRKQAEQSDLHRLLCSSGLLDWSGSNGLTRLGQSRCTAPPPPAPYLLRRC